MNILNNKRMRATLIVLAVVFVVVSSSLGFMWRAGAFGDGLIAIDPDAYYPVTYVVDGDTFKVRIAALAASSSEDSSSREITIRVLGINTPETVHPTKAVECYGPEASAETKSLLDGRRVRLVFNHDREKVDKYGRYLMYAYRDDGLFVNEFLIRQGYAREYTVGTPYSFRSSFRDAQKAARAAKRGLWGACGGNASMKK